MKMLKPIRIRQNQYRKVSSDIKSTNIVSYGYGIFRKKTKLGPVMFDRRLPYDDDVVVQIMYCGVCASENIQLR